MRAPTFAGSLVIPLLLCFAAAPAATYYVSPKGDDSRNGATEATTWQTCQKVDHFAFQPGDTILFQRGGEWRERLFASSSGSADHPITYDAYGQGGKPRFWGSELLDNKQFISLGKNNYAYNIDAKADSVLQDHVFLPAGASAWVNGILIVTVPNSDPRTDGKIYTACTRGNVIYSGHRDHLVFRNLIADETAGQIGGEVQGYGIRVEGSTDVLMEYCEAYRCGRHHIACINSTGFVGRHLHAGYIQPATPGGNSIFCSYADQNAPVAKCTSVWDDISAEHLEGGVPGHGDAPIFTSHGPNTGLVTMLNTSTDHKISFMSGPVVCKGGVLSGKGSIETFGEGTLIDGVTITDSAAIDQYGKNGTIQNCVAYMTPSGGGATGYPAAIVLRAHATGNIIRFNTLVTRKFSGLEVVSDNMGTQWYGNIMLSDGVTVMKGVNGAPLTTGDAANTDYNFYGPNPTFGGVALDAWKALGFDTHSLTGDPKFVDAANHNFALQPDSPCLGAAKVAAALELPADFNGTPRLQPPSIGAFEKTSPTTKP